MRATPGEQMWAEIVALRCELDSVRAQSQSTTSSTTKMVLNVRQEVRQDTTELANDQEDLSLMISQLRHDSNKIGEALIEVQHLVIDHHHELVAARREIEDFQQEIAGMRSQVAKL